jgi:penicillin-binding protein 1C
MRAARACGRKWLDSEPFLSGKVRAFIKRHRYAVSLLALLLVLSAVFWRLLPSPLFHQPVSAVLLARDGSLLGARIAEDGQWRFPDIAAVPEKFQAALITYEDKRFAHHPGIDPLAIARAVRLNFSMGRIVSGASTLTMQLARSINMQEQRPAARGYVSKFHEVLLALRLEVGYSKQQLLALYASHAPFGGNVVGLEAAAWRYFGRAPATLSWAEAATLAVLPNSPALVTPGRNRARLQLRRDQLLRRLHQQGKLNELDLQAALAEPLVTEPHPLPQLAPHLLATLRMRYPHQHRFVTTLNTELQAFATQVVSEHAKQLLTQGIGNAAALIVDNRSFEVLAYVGNAAWSVNNERSLAVDIVQRPRSTGSILKPFLYAAMLDSGQLLPKLLVPDVPTQFKGFAPENFDRAFRGAVPADEALAHSLNVPAVRLLKDYGYARFYDLLRNLGMSTLTEPPDHYGLTLVLGGAEGTLWDVTRMHANLAQLASQSGGGPAGSYHGLKIFKDTTPTPLHQAEISPAAAWLTLDALLEVPRPAEEANWKDFATSRRIAWKTGTSYGLRDAWAVGSTSHYTVSVWAGNANGVGVPGLTGSVAAAPILFELHNHLPMAEWFMQPVRAMKRVLVCSDDGYLATDQCPQQEQWVPANSHFDQQSPNHQLLHLDASGKYRVDSSCERVANMQHVSWFSLPPTQEYYYRRNHGNYRELPPYRPDCHPEQSLHGGRGVMDFLYPNATGKIYVPIDLDGKTGRVVFEAVHRDQAAVLYWHLDDRYLGPTETIHQMALELSPGRHLITIVDANGNRLSRAFEVLPRQSQPSLE